MMLTRVLTIFLAIPISYLLSGAAHAQNAPVPVFVTDVERQDFSDEIEALGTLQANENVELTATVTELVTRIHFEDGQRVEKGALLVEMDTAEERALQAEEQSRLEEARRQVERLKPLIARGAASKSALDEAELELKTAQARMKALDSRIAQRQISAPFNGVLGLRNISEGALVQPGTRITTIDDDAVMKLDFSVPEVFIAVLKPGMDIEAETDAYPGEIFKGTLSSVDSRIDPVTRAIAVRALLENPDFRLRPGLLMRVRLSKNPRQALLIPEEALLVQGERSSVFVVVPGEGDSPSAKAESRTVETGARRGGEIEILSGLKDGEQIVTHGTLKLRPGAAVIVKAVDSGNESLGALLKQNTGAEE